MSVTTNSALWQKNPILAWREIDGEIVIVSPNDSVLHELNETGSFVWKQLDGHRPAPKIAARLAEEYDVSLEDALRDIETLLGELASRQLLIPVDNPTAGGTE
jgi:coenzyme PQQ synthesis protein D (PqqD)